MALLFHAQTCISGVLACLECLHVSLGIPNHLPLCPAGNEGSGLSQEVQASCQVLLTILPGRQLPPGLESLNVSVATGESTLPFLLSL